MKRLLFILSFLVFIFSIHLHAQQKKKKTTIKKKTTTVKKEAIPENLVWYTDANQAQQLSNSQKKPIFGFFTGSDWCGWCRKLQNDVFAKKEFIKWAAKNVILLELDFPRNKQLSPELAKQNNELQQVFKVAGYPTIWLFYITTDEATQKKNINSLGSLGYPSGAEIGKEEVAFLNTANMILKTDKK